MRWIGIVLGVSLLLAGCSGNDTEPGLSDQVDPTGEEPGTSLGTWDEPLPADAVLVLDGWEVALGEVTALSEGPDPDDPTWGGPEPGHVHVVIEVEATRTGDSPDSIGFRFGMASSSGTELGEYVALPVHEEISSGDIGPGDVASGAMLAAANVPEDELDGAMLTVHDHGSGEVAYVQLEMG